MGANTRDRSQEKVSSAPQKWWQWFLVYPTLLIALIGSVPTLLQLYHASSPGLEKVPFQMIPAAKRQHELWEVNIDCVRKRPDVEAVTNGGNTHISANICESGDVLVTVKQSDSRQVAQWIEVKTLLEQKAAAGLLLSQAVAAEDRIVVAQGAVLCHRWLANGRLLTRIRDRTGNCFDEVTNTYTGVLERRTPAQCSGTC